MARLPQLSRFVALPGNERRSGSLARQFVRSDSKPLFEILLLVDAKLSNEREYLPFFLFAVVFDELVEHGALDLEAITGIEDHLGHE
jgi:hypothetical protein